MLPELVYYLMALNVNFSPFIRINLVLFHYQLLQTGRVTAVIAIFMDWLPRINYLLTPRFLRFRVSNV